MTELDQHLLFCTSASPVLGEMARPYLIEVRTGGELKSDLRSIIYDVADRFDVQGAASPRAVPHITLFGPYNTDQGAAVKETIIEVLDQYDPSPYRIDGFDRFTHADPEVIYADVVPSQGLRALRRELRDRLQPLTYNTPPWDDDLFRDLHITVAFRDTHGKADDIWEYVTETYNPQYDAYATRITNLQRRSMLWEYDLATSRVLSPDEATSAASWEETTVALAGQNPPIDHDDFAPKPGRVGRYWARLIRWSRGLEWWKLL